MKTFISLILFSLFLNISYSLVVIEHDIESRTYFDTQFILDEISGYRDFCYREGAPEGMLKVIKDNDGYYWFVSSAVYFEDGEIQERCSIYRFNGLSFEKMTESLPEEEQQALLNILFLTDDGHLFIAGENYLYRWEGTEFARFSFPEDDAIRRVTDNGKDIICVGVEGYSILSGNNWNYRRHSDSVLEKNLGEISDPGDIGIVDYFDSRKNYWYTKRSGRADFGLFGRSMGMSSGIEDKPLYLRVLYDGRTDSLLVLSKDKVNEYLSSADDSTPIFTRGANSYSWMYFQGTNLLFRIDGAKKDLIRVDIEPDLRIEKIVRLEECVVLTARKGNTCEFFKLTDRLVLRSEERVSVLDITEDIPYHILFSADDTNRYEHHIEIGGRGDLGRVDGKFYVFNSTRLQLEELKLPEEVATKRFSADSDYPGLLFFKERDSSLSGYFRKHIYEIGSDTFYSYLVSSNEDEELIIDTDYNLVAYYRIFDGDKIVFAHIQKDFTIFDDIARSRSEDTAVIEGTYDRWGLFIEEYGEWNNPILGFTLYNRLTPKKRLRFQNTTLHRYDKRNNRLLLYENSMTMPGFFEPSGLYSYDIENGKSKKITTLSEKDRVICNLNRLFVLKSGTIDIYSQTLSAPTLSETVQLNNISNQLLDHLENSERYSLTEHLRTFNVHPLADDKLLFPGNKFSVEETSDEHQFRLQPVRNYRIDTLPEKDRPYEKREGRRYLVIPSFVYNLNAGTVEFEPSISDYTPHPKGGKGVVEKIETSADKIERLTWNWIKQDAETPDAFTYNLSLIDDSDAIRTFIDNDDFFVLVNDKVHYISDGRWLPINIESYRHYGYLIHINKMNDIIYIWYKQALVRHHIDTGKNVIQTPSLGLPREIEAVFNDRETLVVSEKSIFKFSEIRNKTVSRIPYAISGNRRYAINSPFRLRYSSNNIRIPVHILNVLFPEQCQLEYRLVGFDEVFRKEPYRPYIRYHNLRPGRYIFEAKTYSPEGIASDLLTLNFRVLPPWYNSWIAYIVYLLLFTAALRTLFIMRTKQLQQRNIYLEQQVSQRTQELEQSNEELHEKTELLQERQERIQESIDYASLIQKSILPQSNDLTESLNGYFILWKPRDIVGGDFYWLHNIEDTGETLFAVIDCTGHGVPGALISMSVYSLLNNIVKERKILQPADILNNIHRDIGSALHQESRHTQQDGLDISLVKINKEKKRLTFAGAALHLIYYDGIEPYLRHIRGSKHSIGGMKWRKQITFEQKELPYSPNAILYLYSDGIIDQLQADKERRIRFGHPSWIELLNGIYTEPLSVQQNTIEEKLNELLTVHEQRDDITIVSIKL